MKKRMLGLFMSLVLILTMMPIAFASPALAADPTTSITVTKLANDGVTILDQITITVEQMMAGTADLPIYGDGVTHYYFQGPTFDLDNMWDPDEMINIDSRDYGAAMGNDVKDLCEKLSTGGASPGDTIKIKASDGWNKIFYYEDVYTPEPEQGKMIITWYTDGTAEGTSGSVTDGSYSTGMRLLFFADTLNPDNKHVFGIWDMHETLAEECWHYYYDGVTLWPSSSGLSGKWISDIIIYSSEPATPEPDWPLTLDGASTYEMSQAEFETGVSCHEATWNDEGDIWSGIPLWRLAGWVDDDIQHGEGAFNDDLASAGYEVKVIAADGYSKTFGSAEVARNDDMIIANTLNGVALDPGKYPLRLVGPTLAGSQKVSEIVRIELLNLPEEVANDSLTATANVTVATIGISLDRESIDYGDVEPGESSEIETVGITNTGTLDVDVTLEVDGVDAIAQAFYEASLYIDTLPYNIATIIASLISEQSENVATQLHVPEEWGEAGVQEAQFIFWAEATE
ncbi:MAG: hypothetical protein PVJ08_07205 [Dehalococcoidia bacterium]|jgi:DMSO/TMAO reductase YedYZ molybdopterin-dependent catalytic subunit